MRPFLFALVIALVAGALGAYGFRRSRYARPVPAALAQAALAREVAAARELGFAPTSPEPTEQALFEAGYGSSMPVLATLELDADECIAAVASTRGWGRLSWLRISRDCPSSYPYRDPNDLSVHENVSGIVAHTQFCAWEPTRVEVCVYGHGMRTDPLELAEAPPTVLLQILRADAATIGGPDALARGLVTHPDPLAAVVPEAPPVPTPAELTPTELTPTEPTELTPTEPSPTELDEPRHTVAPPAPEPTPGARTRPSNAEVRDAMMAAARSASVCASGEESATARVTFGPSGAVSAVAVSGTDGDTAACIARIIRRIRLEPFDGAPTVVLFPFNFR